MKTQTVNHGKILIANDVLLKWLKLKNWVSDQLGGVLGSRIQMKQIWDEYKEYPPPVLVEIGATSCRLRILVDLTPGWV